jgi:hypothetical protein
LTVSTKFERRSKASQLLGSSWKTLAARHKVLESAATAILSLTSRRRSQSSTLAIPIVLLAFLWVALLWLYQPSRYYFFNDEWDMLYGLLLSPRSVFALHNEYFLPLFKIVLLAEYKLFGPSHQLYMLVALALHAGNAVLIYLLAQSFSLRPRTSLIAALMFAFSAVPWEITASSFGQCVTLPTFCTLLAVLLFRRKARTSSTLVVVAAISLAGFWVGGPPPIWLPLLLSLLYFQSNAWRSRNNEEPSYPWVLFAIWTPAVLYAFSVRMVASSSSLMAVHHMTLSSASVPGMFRYTWAGTVFGLLSPSLTAHQAYSTSTNVTNAVLITSFLALGFYWLSSAEKRRDFSFLVAFSLLPYPIISLGRLQLGVSLAASSRYQYVPLVGLVLAVMLSWESIQKKWSNSVPRKICGVFGSVLLVYVLFHHIAVIRGGTPASVWGLSAQRFVRIAEAATYSSVGSAHGPAILGSGFPVPESVYPPGTLPTWKMQQVLRGETHSIVPPELFLRDKDASLTNNLVKNGGFEDDISDEWNTLSDATVKRITSVHRSGTFAARLALPPNGIVYQQVANDCPRTDSNRIYSFSIWVNGKEGGMGQSRIVFRDAAGKELLSYASTNQPVGPEWKLSTVSALSPSDTCIIDVELSSKAATSVSFDIDDAIAIEYPRIIESLPPDKATE